MRGGRGSQGQGSAAPVDSQAAAWHSLLSHTFLHVAPPPPLAGAGGAAASGPKETDSSSQTQREASSSSSLTKLDSLLLPRASPGEVGGLVDIDLDSDQMDDDEDDEDDDDDDLWGAAGPSAEGRPAPETEAAQRHKRPGKAKRPCKSKRLRYKALVSKLQDMIRKDPYNFDLRMVHLPHSVLEDEKVYGKLTGRLQKFQDELRAGSSGTARPAARSAGAASSREAGLAPAQLERGAGLPAYGAAPAGGVQRGPPSAAAAPPEAPPPWRPALVPGWPRGARGALVMSL